MAASQAQPDSDLTLRRQSVVPRELTSFVGRQDELASLGELVTREVPLVTIVGPAGIGKTRFVRHFLGTRCAGDALFCDLRGIDTAEGLTASLIESLDGHLETGHNLGALVEAVGELLVARECRLIVLDNFEQLVPAGIEPLHRWLKSVPRATFVATSRRMLHLRGERVYELPPLSLPSAGNESGSEAARLFVDRAKAAEPAFDATAHAEICALVRRLEGIPLALELAAGQMRHHRPGQLLHALEKSPTIALETNEHDVDPRHASLRAAIESSWRLLKPYEQSAVSQLTACRKGFTLEAAEAVLDFAEFRDAPSVREVVSSLREATLLRVDNDVTSPDPLRWDMYEAIWEYACGRPKFGADERHAAYYLARGKEWVSELGSPGGASVRSSLRRELANLHAAFDHFATGSTDLAAIHAAELAIVLYETHRLSRPSLAIAPLSAALQRADADPALRTRLHTARGVCHRRTGESDRAAIDFAEARACAGTNPLLVAELDLEEAILEFWSGDIGKARSLVQRAVDAAHERRSPRLESRARTYLAVVLIQGFQDPKAEVEYETAFRLARAAGDAHGQGLARTMAAACQLTLERGKPIAELTTQARQARDRDDRMVETFAEQTLGILHLDSGAWMQSRRHFRRALEICQANGLNRYQAHTETWLAALDEAEGMPPEFESRYARTAAALEANGDRRSEAFALLQLCAHAAQQGRLEQARNLLERGEETALRFGDASIELVAELQRARVELVESRRATEAGDEATASHIREQAEQRVESAMSRFPPDASDSAERPSLLGRSPEARWALRLFRRELDVDVSGFPILRVWSDGSAFQLGEGSYIQLPNGPMIRAVMRVLAQERANAPGHSVSVEMFIKRCWSDEKVDSSIGSQRVRTIVARLRKAGLADVLRRNDSGYLLIPETKFAWVNAEDAAAIGSPT